MTRYDQILTIAKDNLMFAMHYMNEYMERFNSVKSDAALLQNAKAMYAIMEANPMVEDYYTKYTTDEIIDKVFDAESPTEALRRFDLFPYYRNDKTFVTPNLQNVGSLDNIKNAPTWSGLYFIGQVTYNKKDKQIYCWVKIGKSQSIQTRMNGYKTALTMFDTFDYLPVNKQDLSIEEAKYHILLKQKAIAECALNDEWFLVDSDTYDQMQEQGFKIF